MKTSRPFSARVSARCLVTVAIGILLMTLLESPQSFAAVCPAGSTVQGVDVSQYQGTVNWSSVKSSGVVFAYARVSDGQYLDTQFNTNYAAMKTAGLFRGAYQFFEPAEDPTAQANIMINAIGYLQPGDLPPQLDVEVTGGQSAATIIAHIQTWVNAVQSGTGRVPIIYTAASFWNGSAGASSAFSTNPLWVANWNVTCPTLPTAWSNWLIWQYSDSGSVSGISGPVDLDEFNGSLADLDIMANLQILNITQNSSPKSVTLSWPASSTATLQQTSALGSAANWTNVTTSPTVVNGQNQIVVTLSAANPQSFYRLSYAVP
jgi:lysozyme